jgi:two-component sensor histidine kinase
LINHPLLQPVAETGLALAVIASSSVPLLLLNGDLRIVAASVSFGEAFGFVSRELTSRPLLRIGGGEWNVPQLASLLRATASGDADIAAYEMDLNRPGHGSRRLVINARKLDYGDILHTMLLLSATDVTEARQAEKAKDDLLREKAVLLQELQHRVANSLQIIASVLMLSARRVQSAETRGHLTDAHHRIMSAASVQKQLSVTSLGDVRLRPYLIELCRSLAASMIGDRTAITLSVTADDAVGTSDVAVSLGLIVTELVINALKHAFPNHRPGKITVTYTLAGGGWTLCVTDDGVGMGFDPDAKPGLGTGIVEALAKQLQATVDVSDEKPGTKVSIVGAESAAKDEGEVPAKYPKPT